MNITDLLQGPLGNTIIQSAASQFGLSNKEAGKAVGAALPAILSGLQNNSKTTAGAESLNKALEAKHDGSLLSGLGGLLGGGNMDALLQDGGGILGHVFGNNLSGVQNNVAKQAGISSDKAGSIIKMLAPIVMAFLGKEKKANNVNAGGLDSLLGGILGGGAAQKSGGGLLDMVSGMLGGGKASGNPLSDLLGKFTKK